MLTTDYLPPDIRIKARDFTLKVDGFYFSAKRGTLILFPMLGLFCPCWILVPSLVLFYVIFTILDHAKIMMLHQKLFWALFSTTYTANHFTSFLLIESGYPLPWLFVPIAIYVILMIELRQRAESAYYNNLGYNYTGTINAWDLKL